MPSSARKKKPARDRAARSREDRHSRPRCAAHASPGSPPTCTAPPHQATRHAAAAVRVARVLFSFIATAPTEIYTLSLHDALPILFITRISRNLRARDAYVAELAQH